MLPLRGPMPSTLFAPPWHETRNSVLCRPPLPLLSLQHWVFRRAAPEGDTGNRLSGTLLR